MLRVLYKVELAPGKKPSALEGGRGPKNVEAGAERPAAKKSSSLERIRAAKKLADEKAAAKREADEHAAALRGQIFESDAEDDVTQSLNDLQNIEKNRVAEETSWDEEQKNLFKNLGYDRDAEAKKDDVLESINELGRIEADRVREENDAERLPSDLLEEDIEELPSNLLEEDVEELSSDLLEDDVETTPRLKNEVPSDHQGLLPELPVNAPKAQIEAAHRQLVEGFAHEAKTALNKELRLKTGLQNAESDTERARFNAAIAETQREADANLALEFYAEQDNPRAAQRHYNQMRAERVVLLNDAEARRVLEKLNEMRGDTTWENGEYITPDMIQDLDPMDRDLGRRWHAAEKAAAELASGIARLREHHETRVHLTALQTDAILDGNWASEEMLKAIHTPGMNLENATDQIFTDLRRFDVPKTAGEKAVAAVLNFKILGGFPGRALLGVFGRKYANKSLNEAASVIEPVQTQMRKLDAERNMGKGIVLGRNNVDMGAVSNITNFGAATRAAELGGRGYTSGSRAEGGDVAISAEAHQDLEGIIQDADNLTRNASSMSRSAAETLMQDLEETLARYTNTPTARSRAYDLAAQSLEKLQRTIQRLPQEAAPSNKQSSELQWEPVEADLGVNWDEDGQAEEIEDLTHLIEDDVDASLEAKTDRLSRAQLEKIDRATEVLESSQKGLEQALGEGQPLGKLFTRSLEQFVHDREITLRLIKLNRLDNNPAAQDLAQALTRTRELLKEHAALEARPLTYRAVVDASKLADRLQRELDAPSALIDQRRAKADLDRIELALREPIPNSKRYDALRDRYMELYTRVNNLDFADADLPVAGMSTERASRLESANSDLLLVSKEMQSLNLRPNKLTPEQAATNGARYRNAIQQARGLLRKTPASMRSSAQAQTLQTSLGKAEEHYQRWAKRNGERQLTNVQL